MRSVEYIQKSLLKTDPTKAKTEGLLRIEPGINGTELATYLHPGGHVFPVESLPLIVKFFQRQTNK